MSALHRPSAAALLAMALWGAALLVPWQPLLGELSWLRVAIAVALFCAPGFALASTPANDGSASPGARVLFGFVLSVMAVGLGGLAGSLLGLRTAWLEVLLVASGMAAIGTGVRRNGARALLPSPRADIWTMAVLGAAFLLGARLAFAPYIGGDDLTHVARITAFQQQDHLGFAGLALGGENVIPPRYWLSFWPLWQALLATVAAVHPLALTANDLGPVLAVLALLAVYDLGRALGMSRRLVTFAVAAQIALLLGLVARTQPGWLFFERLTEDKFLAFFVLAPAAFAALARLLAQPHRGTLIRLACAWLALAFSHATSLGMAFLVGAAWCTLELLAAMPRRAAIPAPLLALALLLGITGAAATVRLVPHPFNDKLSQGPAARFASVQEDENSQGRINIVAGTPFFGIGEGAAPLGARLLGASVLVVALVRARRERLARFLVASLGVVALAVVPYTGWLLGKVVPPFHLWRMLCLVPFGIAAAFVARLAAERIASRHASAGRPLHIAGAVVPVVLLLVVALAAFAWHLPPLTSVNPPRGWREQVVSVRFDKRKRARVAYADVRAMADALGRLVPAHAVVLGDGRTNNLLPSMSARVALVCFRSVHQTMLHGELGREAARARCIGQKDLLAGKLSSDEAAAFLARNHVRFALVGAPESWLDALPPEVRGRELVAESGPLRLYRLL